MNVLPASRKSLLKCSCALPDGSSSGRSQSLIVHMKISALTDSRLESHVLLLQKMKG